MKRSIPILIGTAGIALLAGLLFILAKSGASPTRSTGASSALSGQGKGAQQKSWDGGIDPPTQGHALPKSNGNGVVAERLPKLLNRFVQEYRSAGGAGRSRFASEEGNLLVEARLLARINPKALLDAIAKIAEDSTASPLLRNYTLSVLGILMEEGERRAAEPLRRLCEDRDSGVAGLALEILAQRDIECLYRDLYSRKAAEGEYAAMAALTLHPNDGSRSLLAALSRKWTDSRAAGAKLALRQTDMLMANDWPTSIGRIISQPGRGELEDTTWALAVARNRAPQDLSRWARNRIDRTLAKARQMRQEVAVDAGQRGIELSAFDRDLRSAGSIPEIQDPFFDDVLVALYRIGGELSESERARLRTFGYVGDPAQRLKELDSEN
jgi:hypothetical protein